MFLIFALGCTPAWSETLYVNGTTGTDGTYTNGYGYPTGIQQGPMKTIRCAYNQAAPGDVIVLESSGIYDETTQGDSWRINFDRAGITPITIRGEGPSQVLVSTNRFSERTYFIYLTAADVDVRLENIQAIAPAVGHILFASDAVRNGDITIQNCTFNASCSYTVFLYNAGRVIIEDSSILASENSTGIHAQKYLTGLVIRNSFIGNATSNSLDHGAVAINLAPSELQCNYVVIENSVVQHSRRSFDGSSAYGSSRLFNCEKIKFYKTKFIKNSNSTTSNVKLGVEYDTVAAWQIERSYQEGEICANKGQVYECLVTHSISTVDNSPGVGRDWQSFWKLYHAASPTIENCVIKSVDASASNHNLMLGFGIDNFVIDGCFIRGAEGDVGSGAYNLVCKGNYGSIVNSIIVGKKPLSIFASIGTSVLKNTIVATPGHSALMLGNQQNCWSSRSMVKNNIIVNQGNSYCVSFDADHLDRDHLFDYNCYYRADGGSIFHLYNGAKTDLDEVKKAWESESSLYAKTNDQHSISLNPLLDNDYQAKSGQLRNMGSPLVLKSNGLVLLNNDIGATKFIYDGLSSENCIVPSVMDANGDCRVDLADFCYFASEWMTNGITVACINPPLMDVNNDCRIDYADFYIFISEWLSRKQGVDCINPSLMDTNDDCKIDLVDFGTFASEWMHCGYASEENCWD